MSKVLDKSRPYGETFGLAGVRYTQDGVNFKPDGTLSDNQPETVDVTEEELEQVADPEGGEVVDLSAMTKAELDAFAKEQYGVDLDGRMSKAKMIAEIQALAEAEAE